MLSLMFSILLTLCVMSPSFHDGEADAVQDERVMTGKLNFQRTGGVPSGEAQLDVFVPIGKYFAAGDAESLSAWFAPNLEISIFSHANDASKNQAKQILKAFFRRHNPRAFRIRHQAGRGNFKYVLADLTAGGEHFNVTIFASCNTDAARPGGQNRGFLIQQIKIDHIE